MTEGRWRSLASSSGVVVIGDVTVSQLCFGNTIRFEFDDGTRLDIETIFSVHSGMGEAAIDPEGEPTAMAPVLPFLQRRVISAVIEEPAILTLSVTGGLDLKVVSDEKFEAWQITAVDGECIFARPGDDGVAWISPSPWSSTTNTGDSR